MNSSFFVLQQNKRKLKINHVMSIDLFDESGRDKKVFHFLLKTKHYLLPLGGEHMEQISLY